MTIFVIILILSACAAALLSWAFGLCAAWWLILRALLLFVGSFVALTLLYFLGLLIYSLFIDKNKPTTRVNHAYCRVVNETMRFILLLGRVRVHVEGVEQVDRSKPFLLIANHKSNFDPFVAVQAFKGTDLIYICKPSIFKIPLAGGFVHKCGFLSINREDNREALKTILRAVEILKDEQTSVAVYPEGTRNKTDATLLPFRAGALSMAKRGNVPVVVAVTEHTEDVAHRFLIKRTDVTFKVLDVIPADRVKDMRTTELSDALHAQMEAYINRNERK